MTSHAEFRSQPVIPLQMVSDPLPPRLRRDVRDIVVAELRRVLLGDGFVESPSPDPAGPEAVFHAGESFTFARRGLLLSDLCDLQERLIRSVALRLSADLIGGRNVTRLDGMINAAHPRLDYQETLAILGRCGWSIQSGDPLTRDAEATLIRHCGGVPVHVTGLPSARAAYILPYAGATFAGRVHADPPRAACALDLPRLLQFCMGVAKVEDAIIPDSADADAPALAAGAARS